MCPLKNINFLSFCPFDVSVTHWNIDSTCSAKNEMSYR